MRNVTTAAVAVMAMGVLMAATAPPAGSDTDALAARTVIIQVPRSMADPTSTMDMENYNALTRAAGGGDVLAVIKEALDRAPVPPPNVTPLHVPDAEESLKAGRIVVQSRVERMANVGMGEGPSVAQANKLADAIAGVIRERVTRAWEELAASKKSSLARGKTDAVAAADRLKAAREQIAAAEAKLRQETGRIDLSAAGMQAAQDALELERQKIELDLAGLKARREGLQEAIAKQAAEAAAARQGDVALQALTKAVEAAKAHLQLVRQQYNSGVATMAAVSEAERAELDAEARLAERQNSAGGSAEAMAQWNHALVDASIEQREKEARLSAATKRLESLMDAAALRKDLDAARDAEASASKALSSAEALVRKTSDWLDRYGDQHPTIEVRQGPATTEPAAR